MDNVSLGQSKAKDRLTVVILESDLLSYYECSSPIDAFTVSEGHFLTLYIVSASQQTVFTLLKRIFFLMPLPDDPEKALTWSIEAPYPVFLRAKLNRLFYLWNNLSTALDPRSTEFAPKYFQRR